MKAANPKKSLGQHFLTDVNFCRKIAAFAAIKPDDTVIEIGPGTGNLTEVLLQQARRVIGIEYDPEMIRCLQSRFSLEKPSSERLVIIQADILQLDWQRILHLLPSASPAASPIPGAILPATLVGNLPYNISTRILSSMTKPDFRFQSSVVMVQREVANRITATPNSKDYGYFSLLMQYHFAAQRGFDVPAGAFVPRPKIVSQVIKLEPHTMRSLDTRLYDQFVNLIRMAFRQRRKTLRNNLKPSVTDEQLLTASFEYCGLARNVRPEQVTLQQYLCMTRVLSCPS